MRHFARRERRGDSGVLINHGEREWKSPLLLYADDALFFPESQELDRVVGRVDDMCRRKMLKVNANKGKMLVPENVGMFQSNFRVKNDVVDEYS